MRRPAAARRPWPGARPCPAAGRGSGSRRSRRRRRRRPRHRAAGPDAGRSGQPRTRPAGPRSSDGRHRRRHAPPARRPRTDGAASRRGCGGSRGRVVPSSRSRSRGTRRRRGRTVACWYWAAARSSSWAEPRPFAPATRAGRGRQVVAARTGEPLRVGVVQGQRVERQVVRCRARARQSSVVVQVASVPSGVS